MNALSSLNKQQGASISGVILLIIMLGLLGKFAVGVIPAYVGDFQLKKLVNDELHKANAAKQTERQFLDALDRQLSINANYNTNAKDIITFTNKTPGMMKVKLEYSTESQYYKGTYVVNRFSHELDGTAQK